MTKFIQPNRYQFLDKNPIDFSKNIFSWHFKNFCFFGNSYDKKSWRIKILKESMAENISSEGNRWILFFESLWFKAINFFWIKNFTAKKLLKISDASW